MKGSSRESHVAVILSLPRTQTLFRPIPPSCQALSQVAPNSFQCFLLEVSLNDSDCKELCGGLASLFWGFSGGWCCDSRLAEAWRLATVVWTGWLPCQHRWSIWGACWEVGGWLWPKRWPLSRQFAPAIEFSTTLFYLGCHRRLEPFAKESDESGLFWEFVSVGPDNLICSRLYPETPKNLQDSSRDQPWNRPMTRELLHHGLHAVLMPSRADPTMEEWGCHRCAIGIGGVKTVLTELPPGNRLVFAWKLSWRALWPSEGHLRYTCKGLEPRGSLERRVKRRHLYRWGLELLWLRSGVRVRSANWERRSLKGSVVGHKKLEPSLRRSQPTRRSRRLWHAASFRTGWPTRWVWSF